MKYEVTVTVIEKHVVIVEADSMMEAKELAEVKINANETKYQTRLIKQSVATRLKK